MCFAPEIIRLMSCFFCVQTSSRLQTDIQGFQSVAVPFAVGGLKNVS